MMFIIQNAMGEIVECNIPNGLKAKRKAELLNKEKPLYGPYMVYECSIRHVTIFIKK